jgi:hypothetical protein
MTRLAAYPHCLFYIRTKQHAEPMPAKTRNGPGGNSFQEIIRTAWAHSLPVRMLDAG